MGKNERIVGRGGMKQINEGVPKSLEGISVGDLIVVMSRGRAETEEQEEDAEEEKLNLKDVRRELVDARNRLEDALEEEANVKKQKLDYQESSSSSEDSSSEDEEEEEEKN